MGPVFDISAYNAGILGNREWGVKGYKERGIMSFDEQYDAFDFVYYVERAENSYQMKPVTNRFVLFF